MPELKIPQEKFYSYFSIPEDATEDTLKEIIENDFIKKSEIIKNEPLVNELFSKKMSSLTGRTIKEFQSVGVELDQSEYKGKKLEEVLTLGLQKHVEMSEAVRKELEGKIGQGSDEAVKEWQGKYEKLNSKYEQTTGLLTKTKEEFEGFKLNTATERKNEKLNDAHKRYLKSFEVDKRIKELELEGYEAHMQKNYKLDLDETGVDFITDLKGERIKHPDKAGEFMTPTDVYKKVAIEKNLIQKNQFQDRKVFNFVPDKKIIEGDPNPGRKVHPRAAKAAQQG